MGTDTTNDAAKHDIASSKRLSTLSKDIGEEPFGSGEDDTVV